jgi:hypothetical protein
MSHATLRVLAAEVAGKKDKSKTIPDQLIVRLKPGAKIDDLARLFGAKVIGKIDAINTYLLKFGDKDAADAALTQLAANGDVASIENNYSIDMPDTQMQPTGASTAGPPSLQLKDPPASGRLIVGLVDTQVQSLGAGLDAFMLKQLSAVDEGQLDPSVPTHGTAMAETMLRAIEQETQGKTAIEIQPVDVFGANENTTTFDVANGIVIAYNNGAKVINLSLGSTADADILRDLIDQLTQKDILVVGAKGNQPTSQPFFPAAYNNVLAVTALDSTGQLASYANRADIPALGAPGTSDIFFNHQTWQVTGTSPAAADVSGLAAGYMEQNAVDAAKARTWLQQNLPNK